MEQLNTLIEIQEMKYQNNSLKHTSNGYLDIKYFGNETTKENIIYLNVEITKEIESFKFNVMVNFSYINECSRCLNRVNNIDKGSFERSFYEFSNNDYDINFEDDSVDLLPIISEIIINKMDFNKTCKKDCKGLCYICGKDQNQYICSHNEKNVKESPFSPLSELDL